MKKALKEKIAIGITVTVFIIITLSSFALGMYINNKGSDITDFCKAHYGNKTFLKTIGGDSDNPQPTNCVDTQWRTGWLGYCNSTCQDNYDNCMQNNATSEQIRFSQNCHWMGPDYLILLGTLMFGFFIPMIIALIFGMNFGPLMEEKDAK